MTQPLNSDNMKPIEFVERWFTEQGWEAFAFQREVWQRYLAGQSGLIHSATGTGKTYAAWLGPVLEELAARGKTLASIQKGPAAFRARAKADRKIGGSEETKRGGEKGGGAAHQ